MDAVIVSKTVEVYIRQIVKFYENYLTFVYVFIVAWFGKPVKI